MPSPMERGVGVKENRRFSTSERSAPIEGCGDGTSPHFIGIYVDIRLLYWRLYGFTYAPLERGVFVKHTLASPLLY